MSTFWHIVRTFLLCGGLGLMLYLGLGYLAQFPITAPALAVLLLAALLPIWAWDLWRSFKSGEIAQKGGAVRRRDQPVWYWTSLIFFVAAVLCAGAVLLLGLDRLWR